MDWSELFAANRARRNAAKREHADAVDELQDLARRAADDGLSVADIARLAGVSVPRVYQLLAK